MIQAIWDQHTRLRLAILSVAIFLLVRASPVAYTAGDARSSLLTSQALLQHGTIRLDAYYDMTWPDTVSQHGDHLYHIFPIGTSIWATPFVLVANLLGQDMSIPVHDAALQKTLGALATALAFLLIYLISRCFVGATASLLLSTVFVLGSSIASTMGSALWSTDFALVFTLAALLLLLYDAQGPYNPATQAWNRWPTPEGTGIAGEEALMLDWRYPQFLASDAQLAARSLPYLEQPLRIGQTILPTSAEVLFDGWHGAEGAQGDTWRWTADSQSHIVFHLDPAEVRGMGDPVLAVEAGFNHPQRVTVLVNGHRVGQMASTEPWTPSTHTLPYPLHGDPRPSATSRRHALTLPLPAPTMGRVAAPTQLFTRASSTPC